MSTTSLALRPAASSQVGMQLDKKSAVGVSSANSTEQGYVPLKLIALPASHGLASSDDVSVEVPKEVREYPMPGSRETHEMALASDTMLVISQQTNSTLVKVRLDNTTGRPLECARFCLETFWDGLHGLYACQSEDFKGQVWATLQFKSLLIRIDIGEDLATTPTVKQEIPLPSSVKGPHCIYEIDNDLWTSCKDSSHVVRINYSDPTDYTVYPCSPRPIFMAKHAKSKDLYASLDLSSKIWRLEPSTGQTSEIDIPPSRGTTPVGLIQGPDGNVWFVLVGGAAGGTGTFARISKDGDLQWFTLTTSIGAKAGLLHLAFDQNFQQLMQKKQANKRIVDGSDRDTTGDLHLWLLGSTLVADVGNSIDAVFSVVINADTGHLLYQHSLALPTQICWTHRVLPHPTGALFVTQLKVSLLAHIAGSIVFNPTGVASETADFYNDFGLGESRNTFKFSDETASSGAAAALPSAPFAAAAAAAAATPQLKASSAPKSKRART